MLNVMTAAKAMIAVDLRPRFALRSLQKFKVRICSPSSAICRFGRNLKSDPTFDFEGKTCTPLVLDVRDFDCEIATPVTLLSTEMLLHATLKHAKNQVAIR